MLTRWPTLKTAPQLYRNIYEEIFLLQQKKDEFPN